MASLASRFLPYMPPTLRKNFKIGSLSALYLDSSDFSTFDSKSLVCSNGCLISINCPSFRPYPTPQLCEVKLLDAPQSGEIVRSFQSLDPIETPSVHQRLKQPPAVQSSYLCYRMSACRN